MKRCFNFYNFFSVLLVQVYAEQFRISDADAATAPGDIIIGGLFPIHESVNTTLAEDGCDTRTCNMFSNAHLVQSLVLVQAVEEINRSYKLGNLTLGYYILDSCSDVTTALQRILSFMRIGSGEIQDHKCISSGSLPPPVLAVVGDLFSEVSISVARQLNLEHIPQISYASTSGLLSDKNRFPNFMRTVPEDDHQVHAIIQILKMYNWTWIGVVTPDGDYGRYALERLRDQAAKNNICLAFTSILPDDLSDEKLMDHINHTIKNITESENATVIVSFAKAYHMEKLFDNLLCDPRGRGKVWVASDSWSQTAEVLGKWTLDDVGTIIGVTLKSGNTSKFKQYLSNLDPDPDQHKNNTFLREFLQDHKKKQQQQRFEQNERLEAAGGAGTTQGELSVKHSGAFKRVKRGKPVKPGESANDALRNDVHPFAVFSVGMAVRAIAQAAADLCVNSDCKTGLQPFQFLGALRNATFDLDGQNYTFDNRGDLNTGYDIVLWKKNPVLDVHNIVAYYSIQNKRITFTSESASQEVLNLSRDVTSRCSDSCPPGYRIQSAIAEPVCCYVCHPCPEDYFSDEIDSNKCDQCDVKTEYSKRGSANCTKKTSVFLGWTDNYCATLLAFTALGALLSIVAGIIFIASWNTPVVRASVGPISLLLLLSLLGTFVSVILFGGEPNLLQCQARQALFGLSFTLCVSCILVKSCKIILAFEFDPNVKRVLKKLYKPYIIIGICMSLQVVICTLWLTCQPPIPSWENMTEKDMRLLECDERSFPAFAAMLSYIGILAFIGFGFAFKGRKLPNSYNEAKFITFGMLIYFICWIIFGPVYFTVKGKYLPAVEMVVILFSAYGILFCHFLPKCYIILCKKEANTVRAFQQDVRTYSQGDIDDENREDRRSPSSSPVGLQNSAFEMDLPSPKPPSDQSLVMRPTNSPDSSLSPDSAPPPRMLLNQHIFSHNHRQLRRYSSLPAS